MTTITSAEASKRTGIPQWKIARYAADGLIDGAFRDRSAQGSPWRVPVDFKLLARTRRYRFPQGTPWRGRVIETSTGCLEWQGRLNRHGYGTWGWPNNPAGSILAHRIVYTLERGEIPEGLHLDHLCRNRRCVNPDHLEPVTCAENLRRSPLTWQGSNSRKTHCPQGHPYDEANTRFVKLPNGGTGRQCRQCGRDRYHARKAVA